MTNVLIYLSWKDIITKGNNCRDRTSDTDLIINGAFFSISLLPLLGFIYTQGFFVLFCFF